MTGNNFDRLDLLKSELNSARPAACLERARAWTEFHRENRKQKFGTVELQARTLDHALTEIPARINDHELIVGNFTSHRVGGICYPDLHSLMLAEDMYKLDRRKSNPIYVTK